MSEFANQDYVKVRDKLIPEAVKYADMKHTDDPDKKEKWARTFILKMDRMAVDAGIQAGYFHRQSKATIQEEVVVNNP